MKKSLLATTAIVGASMLGAAAAEASDAPELSLSGFLRFETHFVDQDVTTGRGRAIHMESDDAGINFNASATADNGLKYAAKIEMDTDGANAGIDETRIRFSGDWGILDLGDDDGAEDAMAYGGENVACTAQCGFDGGAASVFNFLGAVKSSPNLGTGGGDTSDASKVTYYTPRINGVQLGLSYTPDSGNNLASTISASDTGDIVHAVGVGLNWVGKMGDFDSRLHVTGGFGQADDDVIGTEEDASGYMVGGGLGWENWKVAAGYGNAGDGLLTKGLDTNNGQWWSTGLSYAVAPYTLAVGWFHGKARGTTGSESTDFIALMSQMNVAPGLDVYAEIDLIDVSNPNSAVNSGSASTTTETQNSGAVLHVGTKVSF